MFRAVLLLCAMLSAGLVAGPADARSRDRNNDTEQRDDDRGDEGKGRKSREERRKEHGRESGDWIDRRQSAKDAARIAQMRNGGGQVLSVDPVGNGHRVKLLKDGVVRVYVVED